MSLRSAVVRAAATPPGEVVRVRQLRRRARRARRHRIRRPQDDVTHSSSCSFPAPETVRRFALTLPAIRPSWAPGRFRHPYVTVSLVSSRAHRKDHHPESPSHAWRLPRSSPVAMATVAETGLPAGARQDARCLRHHRQPTTWPASQRQSNSNAVLYGLAVTQRVLQRQELGLIEGGIGRVEARAADGMMRNAGAKGPAATEFLDRRHQSGGCRGSERYHHRHRPGDPTHHPAHRLREPGRLEAVARLGRINPEYVLRRAPR